jgi:hypothetical protein
MRQSLQLNVVESFDFFPNGPVFEVMPERKEFGLGPNEDHVSSVFHIVQETGNEHLARTIRRQVENGVVTTGRPAVERRLADLERGRPIDGKLSDGHYGVPYANFTRDDIRRALGSTLGRKTDDNHDDGTAPLREEIARASSDRAHL